MDYAAFRRSPNVEDRRNEFEVPDPLGRLISIVTDNPMMAYAGADQPVITQLGQQAGMLDIDPAAAALRLQYAKRELAEMLRKRGM